MSVDKFSQPLISLYHGHSRDCKKRGLLLSGCEAASRRCLPHFFPDDERAIVVPVGLE